MKKLRWMIMAFFLIISYFSLSGRIFALENSSKQAKVYFIQPKASQPMYVFANSQFLSRLERNTYFLADLNPGLNTIGFSKGRKIDMLNVFDLVPGQTYYVAVDYNGYHSLLDQSEGMRLLKNAHSALKLNTKRIKRRALKIVRNSTTQDHENQLARLLKTSDGRSNITDGLDNDNVLPQYTPIKLKFMDDLSSSDQTSHDVRFQVAEDVIANNKVWINKGTLVNGQFLKSLPARSSGNPGIIDIMIPSIKINAEIKIPVIGRYIKSGVSEGRKVGSLKTLGYLAIFWNMPMDLGTLFLEDCLCEGVTSSIKGKNVTIPQGEEFTVWTRCDIIEGQALASDISGDNGLKIIRSKIPPGVLFPDIDVPPTVDLRTAYDICLNEIHRYNTMNVISYRTYDDYKITVNQLVNSKDIRVSPNTSKAKGYYLKVDLDIDSNQMMDKGTFTLYDSITDDLICKFQVKEAFGWSYDNTAKKLLHKGIQKLFREWNKV